MYGIGALPEGRRKRGLGMVFDGIVALFGERVLAFDADAAHHYAALAIKARAAGKGLPMADGYIAAIAAARIRRRHPRRRALSGSGHCRHQSLGRVLASIRDRTNIVTETAFSSLPLAPALLQNLESLGFTQMTPIQAQSLPLILEGRDLIAQAKTGSGKTAAFGLGLLQKINLLAGAAMPGAVPHAGTGRPGGAGTALAGAPDLQHQGADPVRRRGGAPPGRVAGPRRPRRGRHAGPHPGPPGARQPGPGRPEHPGAGRGRPHGRHGLLRRYRRHRLALPDQARPRCSRPPTPTTSASWPPVSCAIRPRSRSRPSTTPAASSRSSTRSSPRNA